MKVSVLIPTYNHVDYIELAIRSALRQKTNFEYEILIGENCSTDGTRAITQAMAEAFPDHIRLFSRPNNIGMFENMKALVNDAKGEYIAWLEGDDLWLYEEKLQKQVDFLDAHPDFVVCGHNVERIDENNVLKGHGIYRFLDAIRDAAELRRPDPTILNQRDFWLMNSFDTFSCVMIRMGMVDLYPDWMRPFDFLDWPQYLLLLTKGKAKFIEERWTAYRIRGTWDRRNDYEKYIVMVNTLLKCREHIQADDDADLYGRMLLTLKKTYNLSLSNPEFVTPELQRMHAALCREVFGKLQTKNVLNSDNFGRSAEARDHI